MFVVSVEIRELEVLLESVPKVALHNVSVKLQLNSCRKLHKTSRVFWRFEYLVRIMSPFESKKFLGLNDKRLVEILPVIEPF